MFSQVKKKYQVGWQLKGFNLMVILAILISLVVPDQKCFGIVLDWS